MNNKEEQHIDFVIIPAAGYGTRLLPGSKAIPKEMFPIINKPAIEYIVEEACNSGLNSIVLITSKNKDSIVDHFDSSKELESLLKEKRKDEYLEFINRYKHMNFINIRQKEALGLGHAVYTGHNVLSNKPFVVILPDMLIKNGSFHLKKMLDLYKQHGKGVIALMKVPKHTVSSYGIVAGNLIDTNLIDIKDLVEKPKVDEAPSDLAILGRYILPYNTMNILKDGKPDHSGEIQLTNGLIQLAKTEGLLGYIVEGEIYDIGNPTGFLKANISYALDDPKLKDEINNFIDILRK